MRSLIPPMKFWLRCFWQGMREWCGDSAYERYLNCATKLDTQQFLGPAEFYVERINRRYSRPNRCC